MSYTESLSSWDAWLQRKKASASIRYKRYKNREAKKAKKASSDARASGGDVGNKEGSGGDSGNKAGSDTGASVGSNGAGVGSDDQVNGAGAGGINEAPDDDDAVGEDEDDARASGGDSGNEAGSDTKASVGSNGAGVSSDNRVNIAGAGSDLDLSSISDWLPKKMHFVACCGVTDCNDLYILGGGKRLPHLTGEALKCLAENKHKVYSHRIDVNGSPKMLLPEACGIILKYCEDLASCNHVNKKPFYSKVYVLRPGATGFNSYFKPKHHTVHKFGYRVSQSL